MTATITQLKTQALEELEGIESLELLEEFRIKYLGRNGVLTKYLRNISELPAEQRPDAGQAGNEFKNLLNERIDTKKTTLEAVGKSSKRIDGSLPGRRNWPGRLHPLNRLIRDTVTIFRNMGFDIAAGPDIETEYYNFDALNTPDDHPARDIQDTFYLDDGKLLRTQTSPVQIRVMENQPPPVKIIAPGRCFRRDTIDATHHINFFQLEGLFIDKDVTLADLKGILTVFAKKLMSEDTQVRFRPHYFPFTEPSVEYDFMCTLCQGEGCELCSGVGWLEIAGAGMVHPKVLTNVGYDPNEWQGFAFGLGFERIAMIKYNIDDIRLFYENDIRFLKQFKNLM